MILLALFFAVVFIHAFLLQNGYITKCVPAEMVLPEETKFEYFRKCCLKYGFAFDGIKLGAGCYKQVKVTSTSEYNSDIEAYYPKYKVSSLLFKHNKIHINDIIIDEWVLSLDNNVIETIKVN